MSAEVLRRAAALMRERAEAASPAPWHTYDAKEWYGGGPAWEVDYTPSDEESERLGSDGDIQVSGGSTEPDAEHIASWHPAVALAVADWLDDHAETAELFVAKEIPASAWSMNWQTSHNRAEAVARAYLGESA